MSWRSRLDGAGEVAYCLGRGPSVSFMGSSTPGIYVQQFGSVSAVWDAETAGDKLFKLLLGVVCSDHMVDLFLLSFCLIEVKIGQAEDLAVLKAFPPGDLEHLKLQREVVLKYGANNPVNNLSLSLARLIRTTRERRFCRCRCSWATACSMSACRPLRCPAQST